MSYTSKNIRDIALLGHSQSGKTTFAECIYDGKMYPIDSNDMAFMLASAAVFKTAFQKASPQLLEPIFDLEVLCSTEIMGDIMGNLQIRRAIIMSMDTEGHYQKIKARVPRAEFYQYSSSLRSLSQGKAKFNRTFADYQAVTPDIQKTLIKEYQSRTEES